MKTIYSNEFATYPFLKRYFEAKGFMFQRIEANPSVPDIFICKGTNWFWVEVKMYTGTKDMWLDPFNADDIKWQSGQLRFRRDMIFCGCRNNYMLIIFDTKGNRRNIIGGLERC